MKSIADAIVYAVAHIACLEVDEDSDEREGEAISHIMAYLSHATPEEEDALASAAQRALDEERSLHHPQQDLVEFFENWMEHMLGRDWDGNQRA